ncbi:MAG TPA: NAD(P)-binding domain-containing protein [Terriglobia bacterium]|nr:NAD(P)-binding domain-containing protein [Terriglobia bacterium]
MKTLVVGAEAGQGVLSSDSYDVVVVGAGPYGLSAAAHLAGEGLRVAVFGKPLRLWREFMPEGMLLRSHWWATNLSDPANRFTFAEYLRVSGNQPCYPVPIKMFIDYGEWFQKNAAPAVDETYVANIARSGEGFALTLVDGRVIHATSVVMAVGLRYFANLPREYARVSKRLVTHSFEHGSFRRFRGQRVGVIGGGQSAVEYSALLHESGAEVHLFARRPIHWLDPDGDEKRTWLDRVRAPRSSISPGWKNWALERFPYLFYRLPTSQKDRRALKFNPAANDWLRERVIGKVNVNEGVVVTGITANENLAHLTLSSQRALDVDHVILATGYQVNAHRLTMLAPSLLAELKVDLNIPVLNQWFESSVPGLYFIGLISVRAFGPLYRFVAGARAAAPRVARSAARFVANKRNAVGLRRP